MPPAPSPGSPALLLSSGVSPVLSVASLARIAEEAGFGGLDLHLRHRQWPNLGRPIPRPAATAHGHRSIVVWVSAGAPGPSADPWAATVREVLRLLALGPDRIVLDLTPTMVGDQSRAEIVGLVETIRRVAGTQIAIAVALDSRSLIGGRTHLAQLTLLRRLAGEWDFEIALDLTGTIDPQWEAEAAIVRLGPRLRLVRFGGASVVGRWTLDSRLSARALAAVLQRSEPIAVSLEPPLQPWQRVRPLAVHRAALEARSCIGARIDQYRAQWAASASVDIQDHPVPHPERP